MPLSDAAGTPHPRVVALLPAWQAAAFIEPTLDSLAAQSFANLEVLISVDKCDDATAEICRAYAERQENFRVVVQPERLGWIANSNWLLGEARGDYFLFAAHDDLLAPDYVARLVAALEAQPRAIIAYSDVEVGYPDGRVVLHRYRDLEDMTSAVARGAQLLRYSYSWFIAYRGVFRASAAERIGGLKRHPAGEFAADWPWLLHMALLGEHIRVPEVLCRKRYLESGLSLTWRHTQWAKFGAAVSCGREIRRSSLGWPAKAYLTMMLWLRFGWRLILAPIWQARSLVDRWKARLAN